MKVTGTVQVTLVVPMDLEINAAELAEWAPGREVTMELLKEFLEAGSEDVRGAVLAVLWSAHLLPPKVVEDVEIATITEWSVS
jgi:hypothetical protein